MTTPLYDVGELQQESTSFLIDEINSRLSTVGALVEKSSDDLIRLWHDQGSNMDDVLDAEITSILEVYSTFLKSLNTLNK
jgi:hypothetical protein